VETIVVRVYQAEGGVVVDDREAVFGIEAGRAGRRIRPPVTVAMHAGLRPDRQRMTRWERVMTR